MEEIVKKFQEYFWKETVDMDCCSHHYDLLHTNPYHLEGSVWAHTMMVCHEARDMPIEVQLAAILHDVGKPYTRECNDEKKRVSFRGHEGVSAWKSIDMLRFFDVSNEQIINIFNAIALHTAPFKYKPEKLEQRLVDNEALAGLLRDLTRCDAAGRFYTEGNKRDFEVGYTFKGEEKEKHKEVIVLVGLPGSGKSTYARSKDFTHSILSRDEIVKEVAGTDNYAEAFKKCGFSDEVDKIYNERLTEMAKNDNFVIVDRTHMSRKSRNKTLSKFSKAYKKKAVVFMTGYDAVIDRNYKRGDKNIAEGVIARMASTFFPPLYDEFDEIEYIFPEAK